MYFFLDRLQFIRRFFRRIMKPMTIKEAEDKKAFLAKAYFLFSLGAFGTVLYQVRQGRLNWLEAEGLIPEEETKLSPGELTILMLIIIFQVMMKINCYFFSFSICQNVRCSTSYCH